LKRSFIHEAGYNRVALSVASNYAMLFILDALPRKGEWMKMNENDGENERENENEKGWKGGG
jgi:hypothetical protein